MRASALKFLTKPVGKTASKEGLMRKITAAVLFGLGVAIAGATAPAKADDTIKIGAMLPLSGGAFSIVGEDLQRGFKMALDEANAKGGYKGTKFEMVTGDTQANPTVAVGLAQRLLVRDKVSAIVGLYTSTEDKAVGGIVAWKAVSKHATCGRFGRTAAIARIGVTLWGSCKGASGVRRSSAARRPGVTRSGRSSGYTVPSGASWGGSK